MIKKLSYCIMWSTALFVTTFYSIIGQDSAFYFEGKSFLYVANSHIFPMIMAMTLYLFDVMYSLSVKKSSNDNIIMWILGTIIVFMGGFVASLLVNDNKGGWALFIVAWASLTVLKFVTTEGRESVPYVISED